MYVVKINSSVHIIRKNERVTLCGLSIAPDTMIVEPFRCDVTCPCCDQLALKEIIETRPMSRKVLDTMIEQASAK